MEGWQWACIGMGIVIVVISIVLYCRKGNRMKDEENTYSIDEGIVVPIPSITPVPKETIDHKPFATALSPPRPMQYQIKIKQHNDYDPTKARGVFNLSPAYSLPSCTSTASPRNPSPFQGSIKGMWRGPTPPWTTKQNKQEQ
ncbi:uncharacterized protein B0P05DRAFT_634229 [Gilbertella persicaria]|uniref:uncharacterized protein n=1 Tax=Gilbertella persicaria TaxID=101096 RepID=UPI00221F8761|nr:uncharacterized protein B0P05DRAFT_634229 [Gilbertella persicaria]KAI8092353.1 hypothetical protein B0P05DRAFT_634229 [Gilbertella persicaria]